MNKRGKRWLSAVALAAGAVGTAFMLRRRGGARHGSRAADVWARPGMSVTFRAELMPGRSRAERTYRVERLLPSGRVVLQSFAGEHAEGEFEPLRFD